MIDILKNIHKLSNLDIYLKSSGRSFLFLFDILSTHTKLISSSKKTFLTNFTQSIFQSGSIASPGMVV